MKRSFLNSVGGVFKVAVFGLCCLLATFRSDAQITVTATAGTLGPTVYPQLRLAFNAINAGTHQGAITISVTASCVETATAVLNQNALPASYTSVTIKPAAATTPTISSGINAAVIHLFGATNVTIDGSNTVGGTTKDLTINSTYAIIPASTACVRLGSAGAVGASNITLKNCKFICGGVGTGGPGFGMCVTSGSGTAIFGIGTASHNNVTIQNNSFSGGQLAVYGYGPGSPGLDNGWVVSKNDCIGHGFGGIQINNGANYAITDNTINNVTVFGNGRMTGITLSFSAQNATVSGNKINGVTSTIAGWGATGIYVDLLAATSSNISIFNNFVSSVSGIGSPTIGLNAHGLFMDLGTGVSIYHNTIHMNLNSTGAPTDAAMCFTGLGAGAVNLRDNILTNTQTVGGAYAIYTTAAAGIFTSIDYNDYFANSGNHGFIGGIPRTTLAAIQTGFGGNLNSLVQAPVFVAPTDLHLQTVASNLLLASGIPIAGITTDIDGANRSLTTPTMGAHELINKITYTPLTGTCNDNFDSVNNVLIESPTGIPIGGGLVPRIYFRKGAGPWASTPGTLVSGTATAGTWRFITNDALIGGVVAGDVISYFIVAQTTGGTIFGNPNAGLTAVDVNTITTPPTTPNTFTVNAVGLTGLALTSQVCFSPTGQIAPFGFTGVTGGATAYTLTWSPLGPTPVPAFTTLPASPINVNLAPALPSAVYYGTLTIRSPVSTCTKVYNLTLSVNPTPAAISGATTLCAGTASVLSSTSTGGTWSSSAPAVATVGLTTGVVNGLTGGTADITYTLPTGCKTYANVNVVTPPGPITGPNSTCPMLTITLSNSVAGGAWASSSPTIGTVDPVTGVVTGLIPGNTVITYAISGCAPVSKIVTVNSTPNAITGPLHLCETLTDTLHTTSTGGTWISGNTSVATIGSTSGVYTGVGSGTAAITYKFISTGCISTNTVNIHPAPGTITGGPVVCQGLSITLGNSVPGGTWQSSLPGVISVGSTSGIATAYAASGTVTITYTTAFGCVTTTVIHISTPPTSIAGSHVLCSGYSITLTNGVGGGTWTSSNPSVATAGASTGVITGVVGGTATISYVTTACNPVVYALTVNQTPPPIAGGITLCDGGNTTSLFNSTPGGVWTISGSASISSTGIVTGLTIGASNVVTYTVPNGCYVTAPIIVDTLPAPIFGLDSVCMGRNTTFTTASTGGVWSSNNSLIASVVAATGVVSGVNYGSTTITYAALSGCNRTKPFTVIHPLPLSVTLTRTPSQDTLCAGTPVTFKAHPTNGGVTPDYNWQLFGLPHLTDTGANDSTHTYIPTHGDVIRVFLINSLDVCAGPPPAWVDMPINIYPVVSPNISITTAGSTLTALGVYSVTTATYLGQVYTFNSLVTSGGGAASYQWYVDNSPVPGATNNSYAHTVYDNDTVYCRVNGNPPCETGSLANSNSIVIYGDYLHTNIVTDKSGSMSLFPNPNTGNFTLSGTIADNVSEELTYEVVNVLGQVVLKGSTMTKNGVLSQKIEMNKNTSAGTYMLRVNGANDHKVFHFVIGE